MSEVKRALEKRRAVMAANDGQCVEATNEKVVIVGTSAPAMALADQIKNLDGENAQGIKDAVVEKYKRFFVAPEGSGSYVFEEAWDHELNRDTLRRYRMPAFREVRDNQLVSIPTDVQPKLIREVDIWLNSPMRRTYAGGLALMPSGDCPKDTYNLWRGFGVEPAEGDVTPILSFIEGVICSGNAEYSDYLIRWLAFCVQYPDLQAGVVPVLQGGKGIGKSTIGRLMVKIFGQHGLQITATRHLTGNFNAHLRSTLFLLADEAFYAGDPQGGAVLKGLVTEDYLSIEQKGVDVYQVRNRLKIMMCSNSEWVVPASSDERRYFCLTVSDKHQGDYEYWNRLNAWINNGGAETFLHYLLNKVDLSDFNIRAVPQTEALAHQKVQSLDALPAFLFDALSEGAICDQGWDDMHGVEIRTAQFMARLEEYCQRHPRYRYNIPSARYVGLHLGEMTGATRGQVTGGSRARCYRLPGLRTARETFVRWLRLPSFDWAEAAK